MQTYSERIDRAARLLAEADCLLIGAGAGLSAGAGLNYQDEALFKEWYPLFASLGIRTIWEGVTAHWAPNDANRRRFWAFWATHIQKIRYDAPAGQVYRDLRSLVDKQKHFVITTNVDGQFVKAGFDPAQLYTPQGDYGLFQCATPCSDALYDNREMVQRMLAHMDQQALEIRETDIPRCPNCGGYLERNLRIDSRFVEKPHLRKQGDYLEFIKQSAGGKLILLELGVGFNTPVIIRYPFERIASLHPGAALIRVNLDNPEVPQPIAAKSIGFPENSAQVLQDLTRLAPGDSLP